jgi:hypothetical protein
VFWCAAAETPAIADALAHTLGVLHRTRGITLLIAGGARGADRLAEEWAKAQAIPCDLSASWDGLGRKAGPIRNQRMLDEGRLDLVVAFPGGRGTADMLASRRSRLASGRSVIRLVRERRPRSRCARVAAGSSPALRASCVISVAARF